VRIGVATAPVLWALVLYAAETSPCWAQAQTASSDDPVPPSSSGPSASDLDEAATASVGGLSPICTDRPTKSNSACTVDAGHFQYESDIFNSGFLRLDGVTTDTTYLTDPTFQYGLTSDTDIEANISPAGIVRARKGDHQTIIAGVGDLYLRFKYQFINVEDGTLQGTILPYVKIPTARLGIGDGAVEGGLIVPMNYKFNDVLTLTIDPEVDELKDAVSAGHHLNTMQLVNLAVSLPKHLTLYGELWGDWNFDPTGVVRQYSADTAAAYAVNPRLQLDVGVNVGLNRYTPGAQVYIGISQKF
jgi:hypothetical protein